MIHCLALSPSLDVTYVVDGLEPERISRPRQVVKTAGGKALNVARALQRLGSPVAAIAILGGRSGDWVEELLPLDVRRIEGDHPTRSCVSIATADGMREVYETPQPIGATTWELVAETVALRTRAGDLVVIAGSVPAGVPLDGLAELVRALRLAGVRVFIDTHGDPLGAMARAEPQLIKVNRAEAEDAVGTHRDAAVLARRIAALSNGAVVVTDGAGGSVGLAADGDPVRIAPIVNAGRFPVGSGDSYLAGFVHADALGLSFADRLRWGAACATANTLVAGAAEFQLADVADALRDLSATQA